MSPLSLLKSPTGVRPVLLALNTKQTNTRTEGKGIWKKNSCSFLMVSNGCKSRRIWSEPMRWQKIYSPYAMCFWHLTITLLSWVVMCTVRNDRPSSSLTKVKGRPFNATLLYLIHQIHFPAILLQWHLMARKLLQAQFFDTKHFPLMIILGRYCRHRPYAAHLMNQFSKLRRKDLLNYRARLEQGTEEGSQRSRTLLNCVHWIKPPNSLNGNATVTWSCSSILDRLPKSLWLSFTEALILPATRAEIVPLVLCLLCISVLLAVFSKLWQRSRL